MTPETGKQQVERCLRQVEEHPRSAAAHFNLGLAYTQRGLTDSAAGAYRKALQINPDLVEAWVNLGGVLMLKWDFKGSIEANREALARKDDLILAHYNIGQASLYLGDAKSVLESSRRVVELDPEHAAGHYYLAVGLLATKQVTEARQALARAKGLGHSPQPDFLRALSAAEKEAESESQTNLVTEIGAEPPKD